MTSEHVLSPCSCPRRRESTILFTSEYPMQQGDFMPICPAVGVVTMASCVLAPCGTGLVLTCWLGPEGSAAGLASTGTQGTGLASRSGFFDGAEVAVLPLAPAWAPWVLSRKCLHCVPGHGTDMPPCLLICKSALGWLACRVGVGVPVWYFADKCNFIRCCKLAWHQPAPSQEQVY